LSSRQLPPNSLKAREQTIFQKGDKTQKEHKEEMTCPFRLMSDPWAKETGQGKEYLQNSSITTTHMGFNAPVAPTYHLPHEEASRPTLICQPHHHPTITSHNKAYM